MYAYYKIEYIFSNIHHQDSNHTHSFYPISILFEIEAKASSKISKTIYFETTKSQLTAKKIALIF